MLSSLFRSLNTPAIHNRFSLNYVGGGLNQGPHRTAALERAFCRCDGEWFMLNLTDNVEEHERPRSGWSTTEPAVVGKNNVGMGRGIRSAEERVHGAGRSGGDNTLYRNQTGLYSPRYLVPGTHRRKCRPSWHWRWWRRCAAVAPRTPRTGDGHNHWQGASINSSVMGEKRGGNVENGPLRVRTLCQSHPHQQVKPPLTPPHMNLKRTRAAARRRASSSCTPVESACTH